MRAVEKALDVLERIAAGEVAGPRDLVMRLRVPRSTAHRLLADLVDLELIQRAGERLVIGPRITRLAGGRVGHQRLVSVAQPEMMALRDRCRETVALHGLQGGRRVLLAQAESTHEHRWVYTGQPMPLHAGAASRMLLAMLPEAEAAALLDQHGLPAFTPHTPRDPARLTRDLRRIRREASAISFQEVTPGIASIAVPVGTGDPALCAVLTVTGPMSRLTGAALERIRPLLRETTRTISRALLPGPPSARRKPR
jgi:DNA-binding IclR family transcriptional regulator